MHIIYFYNVAGEYKKDELLEAARSGNEDKLMSLLTPLNVNCHASDGRKVSTFYRYLSPYKHHMSIPLPFVWNMIVIFRCFS